jgi:hypothetical protein
VICYAVTMPQILRLAPRPWILGDQHPDNRLCPADHRAVQVPPHEPATHSYQPSRQPSLPSHGWTPAAFRA